MLNKSICKRCYKDNKHNWCKGYDKLWDKGKVWCMARTGYDVDNHLRGIRQEHINNIPSDCKYKLEHTVLVENNE